VAKTQSAKAGFSCIEKNNNLHIYFTLNAIFSYVSQFAPSEIFVVWDEKPDYRENLRKVEFLDYKNNRSSDVSPHQNNQIIKEILKYIGVVSIFPRDLEADDVISYICRKFLVSYKNIIVSADKDFLQLVNKDTSLYDPIRKVQYCDKTFKERTGFDNTDDWLNAKCLLGDKSDNVTGIPKFTKRKVDLFLKKGMILTEEEQYIFKRNYDLFNLSRIDSLYEEQEYYFNQLQQKREDNWKAFVEECTARQFNNILKKREAWYSLFFLKNKLKELFV
jgi:5'-3' exonuclease